MLLQVVLAEDDSLSMCEGLGIEGVMEGVTAGRAGRGRLAVHARGLST